MDADPVSQERALKRQFWATQIYIIFQYVEILCIFLGSGLSWSHFEEIQEGGHGLSLNTTTHAIHRHAHSVRTAMSISDSGYRWERGEEISCLQVMFAFTVMVIHRIIFALIRNVVKKASGQLYFTSVKDAKCFDKEDNAMIDNEISSRIEEIDRDIQRLRDVGRSGLILIPSDST